MSRTHYIYGIGAALVDTEITLSDEDLTRMAVAKGVMTLVDQERQQALLDYLQGHMVKAHRASGGSAANTIIAASYLGSSSFYSCKVANDDNGQFYLRDLHAAGVATPSHITPPAGITGKCLVMITPDAERTMNTYLGISETLSSDELDLAAVAQSQWVYIEGYLVSSTTGRAAAIALRKHAEACGTRTAISLSDPAMVQFFREGLLEMIGDKVDLIFCNRDEAIGFTKTHNLEEACEALKHYGKQYAITCGADGAWVFDGNTLSQVATPAITPVDTNGAGDMFAGAFFYALEQGKSFPDAAAFANLAAGKVVAQFGPRLRPEQYAELQAQL